MGSKMQMEIELKKGIEVLARLDEIPDPLLSARQFIITNFDTLSQSGKTLEALHRFLSSNDINVGSLKYFRKIYNGVKHSRKNTLTVTPSEQAPISAPEQTAPAIKVNSVARTVPVSQANIPEMPSQPNLPEEESQPEATSPKTLTSPLEKSTPEQANVKQAKTKERRLPYGMRPRYTADGTEIMVDAQTGASTFDIQKTRKAE